MGHLHVLAIYGGNIGAQPETDAEGALAAEIDA